MRLRFLAAAGPRAERDALQRIIMRRSGSSLVRSFESGCLSVWTQPGTPLIFDDAGRAVVVGLMFDRSDFRRKTRLPESANLAAHVLQICWGAYVLICGKGSTHQVVRDPCGAIPVYCGKSGGLSLYASDPEALRAGWHGEFEPNLKAVRQWLAFPFLQTRMTGAQGVRELMPGAVREADGDRVVERQPWLPSDFARGRPITSNGAEAATLLREEILRTAPMLAAGERVTLRLSGGLDSSIVAASLALGGVEFAAVTFATNARDGDEREFARLVARHFGVDLVEITEHDLDLRLEARISPFRRPPNPLLQPLRAAFASISDSGMTMDGVGGDNIFVSLNSASPAVDAFRRNGLKVAVGALQDIAGLHGCTFWAAAASAVRQGLKRRRGAWPADRSFLGPSADLEQSEVHPWLANVDGLPPGSADQIRMIAGVHHFLPAPGPDECLGLHPLLAQPIVELCLRIPSWLWFAGGRDRAVARAAFRGLVPDAILDRRIKGSLEAMFIRGYMNRKSELRDFLVAGRLADEGIVDGKAIADYLDRPGSPRDPFYIRILEIASAEQWLRSFSS